MFRFSYVIYSELRRVPSTGRPAIDDYPSSNLPQQRSAYDSYESRSRVLPSHGSSVDSAPSYNAGRDNYGRPGSSYNNSMPISSNTYNSHARSAEDYDSVGASSRPGYESSYYSTTHSSAYEQVDNSGYSTKGNRIDNYDPSGYAAPSKAGGNASTYYHDNANRGSTSAGGPGRVSGNSSHAEYVEYGAGNRYQ